jgi:serine protease AprX
MKAPNYVGLFFPIFLFSSLLSAQGTATWQSKIEPGIFQKAASGDTVEFLVVLREQTDVREARFIPRKKDKGAFIFQKLTATAARTQKPVRQTLENFGAPYRSFWVVNAVWAEGTLPLLEALAHLPEVGEIQSNPHVILQVPERSDYAPGGSRAVTWGITGIGADLVWAMGYTGQGVVVGGQDTGYDWDHEALKLKYRGWDNLTMTADHNYNWHDAIHSNAGSNDCGFNSPEPCDDHNHGTHTMGTMVGENTTDEFGVAPDAKWMGCRNMDNGVGTPATYIECFEWFLAPTDLNDQNPDATKAPDVINNSWTCPVSEGCNTGNFSTMETAVNNLRNAGVVIVASAGNSGAACETIDAPPAIFAGCLSVGATNSSDTIATFSSRGPVTVDGSNRLKPNVSAPGVGVYSCIRNNNYATWSGTSMAGPHVAGTVALMLSANPSLTGQVEQVETILEYSAVAKTTAQTCGSTPGTNIPNNTFGYGIIDAEEAVNQALALLPVELFSFTGAPDGMDVRLHWETSSIGGLNHFEVEHAIDGSQFGLLGKVAFSPVQASTAIFGYLHEQPGAGINYYRLKMVDFDGSYEYSNVVVIQMAGVSEVMLFPNPAGSSLSLVAKMAADEEVLVRIFDAAGRLVQEMPATTGTGMLSASVQTEDLASGVYFIEIIGGNSAAPPLRSKFVKN